MKEKCFSPEKTIIFIEQYDHHKSILRQKFFYQNCKNTFEKNKQKSNWKWTKFKAMVTELSRGLWVYSVTHVNSVTSVMIPLVSIGYHQLLLTNIGWKALRIFGDQFQLDHHQPKGISIHRCSQGEGRGSQKCNKTQKGPPP
jgi:hypothetical protein